MLSELAIYEPTCCRCQACLQTCTGGVPGAVAPGDILRIAEYIGVEDPTHKFVAATFKATADGPTAPHSDQPDCESPALRPKTRLDGSCIFLSPEKDCTIYPVRPYECSRCSPCDPASSAAAMKTLGMITANSDPFINLWWKTWKTQNRSPDRSPER